MVGFVHSSYSVSETSPEVEVCIQVSGAPFNTTHLGRPVLARISNQGGTATGNTQSCNGFTFVEIMGYKNVFTLKCLCKVLRFDQQVLTCVCT